MTVQHTEDMGLLPVSHSHSSVCPIPQGLRLRGAPAWQILRALMLLATTALRDAGRDSVPGSADQRPNASHCLAPQNLLATGSGPCCPQSFQGQAAPRKQLGACGRVSGATHGDGGARTTCPAGSPPCPSEPGMRGWHTHAASPGQGQAGGWDCACSLPEAAYHAVLTHTEAGTCVPCTDRWED